MPSKAELDDLHAHEDAVLKLEADALAAAQSGDAVLASRLYEDAATAWAQVARLCHVFSEEAGPAELAELDCWAGRAWLARADDLMHAADQVRSSSPATAARIDGMVEYCLGFAAMYFEACGTLRKEHGDPAGARGPLARALSCLLLRRRKMMERDVADPDVLDAFFDLQRVWRKLEEARRASRAKKAPRKKKRAAGKRRPQKRKHA